MASRPISAEPGGAVGVEAGASGEEALLSDLELEVIEMFVNGVKLLGIPKSVGEIYGLLFISREPLPLDELVSRLKISKGSASQGLRSLRNLGAVRSVYVAGERRDFYEAVAELKPLASGFIKEQLEPHLETGGQRLERLKELAEEEARAGGDAEAGKFYRDRVERLRKWEGKARQLLPLIRRFLG
ncbi:MAG: transcriptional regulator [Verrucomicrobiota bacterium]